MKKFLLVLISILALFSFSCDSWMNDDDFYSDIEYEVKVANAPQINVYVRYAMTRQGKTDPDGTAVFKVGIPHEIAATTEPEYGFVRWAAFTTDYLAAGDNQSKNKDVYFIDDEDYNTRLAPHELSSEIVTFEDAKNPTTVVTINEERNDLFLVPIIAHRPTVSLTIPAKGSSNVVKNMSVRINFSKPMNPTSFKNEVGEFDKITITQGIQTFTSDGDIELTSEDITDHFDFNDSMFSANKKMITIKFKPEALEEGFASQSTVIVTVSKDVTDAYGYAMTEDNEINFNVGSRKDQLAPRITWLTAGTAANFQDFEGVYKDVETIEKLGEMTKVILEGSDKAPKEDIANEYFDGYVVNRVGTDTKLVLRVFAEDLAGAGSGQSLDGYESDVTQLVLRARHLYNSDGSKSELADAEAKAKYYSYVPQMNNSSVTGSYRDLITKANAKLEARDVNKDKDEKRKLLDYSYGTLVEYDLKDLPDGLIQVDVAAVDVVQNNGFFDGGSYSDEYGNAWASIFVVKDTTAPDAAANKDYVTTLLSDADENSEFYDFYNANTFSKLAVKEAPAGAVHDNGHARLVALNSNLKWLLVQGEDTSWASSLSTEDKRWALVSDGYKPSDTSLPADGSVAFNFVIMDDMGNISEPAPLDAIMYDNTTPAMGALQIDADSGYINTSVTGNVLEHQTLVIPVTEETAGIKSIEVTVTPEGSDAYATPFASSSLAVTVGDTALSASDYSISGNTLKFNGAYNEFNSSVKIKGLKISDATKPGEVPYHISAMVKDAALNDSNVQSTRIENDSTKPTIEYVTVKNLHRAVSSSGSEEYWATVQSALVDVYVKFIESNTGARVFDFSGSSLKLRADTSLLVNNTAKSVSVDVANNKLTVADYANRVVTTDEGSEVVIKNVELTNDLTNGNYIRLAITDYVTNISDTATEFKLENSTDTIGHFMYQTALPTVASVDLVDQAPSNGVPVEHEFTNDELVTATVNVTAPAAGIYKLTFTGATVDGTTQINNKSGSEYGFTASGNTITLTGNKVLTGANELKISNVRLTSGDGSKTVTVTATSAAERTSVAGSDTITLDKTAPAWVGDGVYVGTNEDTTKIYPHSSTSSSGNVKIGDTLYNNVYFYTKDSINIAVAASDTNRKDNNADFCIFDAEVDNIGSATLVTKFDNVAPGDHTIYAVDKAGNRSAPLTFHVVKDITDPRTTTEFEGYITFEMPAGGNIYRGNTATVSETDTIQNYIIKNNANPYQIHVKLNSGVTSSFVNVHGEVRTALSRYAQLSPLTGSSPVEYYAFSMDESKDWKEIGTGDFTINLACSQDYTPYFIYLKDGCGNVSQYKLPVNWYVDGNVTITEVNDAVLSHSELFPNTGSQKMITYYKGSTTPLVNLTGYSDSCYYPNEDNKVTEDKSEISTDHYTVKSRLMAWAGTGTPSYSDFAETNTGNQYSNWVYLRAKDEASAKALVMPHHYPTYKVKAVETQPNYDSYKLFYIIEDKLGNYDISQLINSTDNTEKWMWDNETPTITVAGAYSVNTIDGINYFSENSSLSLNMTDVQSGIAWDGEHSYTGNDVLNSLPTQTYKLEDVNPSEVDVSAGAYKLKVSGLKDFVGNEMPASAEIEVESTTNWVRQIAPGLATQAVKLNAHTGKQYGTRGDDVKIEASTVNTTEVSNAQKLRVTASRSVTDITFGLTVNNIIEGVNGEPIDDTTTPLLGWVISSTPITPKSFYPKDDAELTPIGITANTDTSFVLTRKAENTNEYEYKYVKDSTTKWCNIARKTQYFYAVNRAGLICANPIIIEFADNPVPEFSSKTFTDVTNFKGLGSQTVSTETVNYLKESSTIKFELKGDTTSTIDITKMEFFIDNATTPVLTKDFTTPVNEYILTKDEILSTLTENKLYVRLYTDSEMTTKLELRDSHQTCAQGEKWTYDNVEPEIQSIIVKDLKEGTTYNLSNTTDDDVEYWSTGSDKTDIYITFTEAKTGVNFFKFAGSTIKLTNDSKLYFPADSTTYADTTVDTSANTLKINNYADSVRGASELTVRISNVQLVSATAASIPTTSSSSTRKDNTVKLVLSDISTNGSAAVEHFTLENGTVTLVSGRTTIDGFNYDPSVPEVQSVILRDRANLSIGSTTIYADDEFTNERYVKATIQVKASESGVSKFIIFGDACFTDDSGDENKTIINYGSETDIPFSIVDGTDSKTIVLDNNRIIKGTFTLTINNIQLAETDAEKTVTIKATSLGAQNSSTSDSGKTSDTITLDTQKPLWLKNGVASDALDSGIYVSTANTADRVYPHPKTTGNTYGLTFKDKLYFYSYSDTIKLKVETEEINKATDYIYVNGTSYPLASSGDTEFSTDCPSSATERTIYAVDKAGNISDSRQFYTCKDSSYSGFDPGVGSYITFQNAMKNGTVAGDVLRSNEAQYSIKSLDDETEPYKIVVKLGSTIGVDSSDIRINGTSFATGTRPSTSFNQLYETEPGVINDNFNTNLSPVEYFAITESTSSYSASDWISISDTTEHKAGKNNKLTVQGGGNITISLPKNGACGKLYLRFKDGCGNTDWYRINVEWIIDDDIGDATHVGNYFITFNETECEAVAEDTKKLNGHVVIHNPYEDSTTTGGMAVNKGVTYYNKNFGTPKLTLKYSDISFWTEGKEVSDTQYSLRGRLIAGNWSNTPDGKPGYSEFRNDDSTVTRRWASNWIPAITYKAWDEVAIEFDLPTTSAANGKTIVTSINEDGDIDSATESYPTIASAADGSRLIGSNSELSGEPYELWYCVEDAVANYRIIQVKNWASTDATGTSIATQWLFDDKAPTLDQTNDVSLSKINIEGTNYYYSTNSRVDYTVRDERSGIQSNGSSYHTYETISPTNMRKSGDRPYFTIADIIGNTATLYLSASGTTWTSLATPALASSPASFKNNENTTAYIDPTSQSYKQNFYAVKTAVTSGSTPGTTYDIMARRKYTDITATLSASQANLLGWIVSDERVTTFSDFYDNTVANNGITQSASTYTFSKKDASDQPDAKSTWHDKFSGSKYFYPVNKAGLVCQTPVIIKFTENPIPEINGNITYTGIESADGVNYVKYGTLKSADGTSTTEEITDPSKLNFTSTTDVYYYEMIAPSPVGATTVNSVNSSNLEYSFSGTKWQNLSSNKITMYLYTNTESSDPIYLTKANTEGWTYNESEATDTWTYDVTRPGFTTTIKDSEGITEAVQNIANSNYYVKSSKALFGFTQSNSQNDIKVYQYKDASNASAVYADMPADFKLDSSKSYKFLAIDKAGNYSEESTITVYQDEIAPTGTVNLAYKKDSSAVTSTTGKLTTSGDTIYYNADSINTVEITVTDITDQCGSATSVITGVNGVGVDTSSCLYYQTKGENDEDWPSVHQTTGTISLTLAENEKKEVRVIIQDRLSNARILKTYTFNGKRPSGTASFSAGDNTDNTYYIAGATPTAVNTIYYDSAVITGNLSFAVGGTDAAGSATDVSFYYTVDNATTPNGTVTGTASGATLAIPVSESEGKNYKLWIKDEIGNVTQLASYVFKTIDFDLKKGNDIVPATDANDENVKNYRNDGTAAAPEIYYNKDRVNKLVLKASGTLGAALPELSTREVVGSTPAEDVETISDSTISLVTGEDPNFQPIKKTYQILAGNATDGYHVLKTFKLDGSVPHGTISYTDTRDSNHNLITHLETSESASTIYFRHSEEGVSGVSSITLNKGDDVKDAAGKPVTLYIGHDSSRTEVTGDLEITVPDESADYTGVYDIIAVDELGNEAKLASYTLNGAGPSVSYDKALLNTVEGADTDADTQYYSVTESGINSDIFYNKTYVKKLAVTLSNVSGYSVTLKAQTGDNAAGAATISDNAHKFLLPSTGTDLSATYKVTATDGVGNTIDVATFSVNGNAPTGTITFSETEGDNDTTKTRLDDGNKVFFRHLVTEGDGGVTKIKLAKSEVKDAAGTDNVELYYNTVADENKITDSLEIPCPGVDETTPANSYKGTYKIIAVDGLKNKSELATFELNGQGPSGNVKFTAVTGTGLSSDGSTIYFKHGDVSAITLEEDSTDTIKDAAGNTLGAATNGVSLYLNNTSGTALDVDTNHKFGITPPGGPNYTGTYKIIAKDILGNETELKSYTLNGADPSGSIEYKFAYNDTELTPEEKQKYIKESGKFVYYNKTKVNQILVTVKEATGWGPLKISSQKDLETAVSINNDAQPDASYDTTLSIGEGFTYYETYKIMVSDAVGNTYTIKEFELNASGPTGSVVYDDTANSSDYTKSVTTSIPKKIYFNNSQVSSIKFKKQSVSAAASDLAVKLYYNEVSEANEITDSLEIPCPPATDSAETNYKATYEIIAVDELGSQKTLTTYELNGQNPSGTISYTPGTGTAVSSDGNTIYFKHGEEGVESVTLTKGTDVKSASGADVDLYLNEIKDSAKFENGVVKLNTPAAAAGYKGTYKIYAKDSIGNTALLKTVTLNGADPTATLTPSFKKDSTAVTSGYSVIGGSIYYNINSVNKLIITPSNPIGYNVTYTSQKGTENAQAFTDSCSFDLPVEGTDLTATYKITATDGVGNSTVYTYNVAGNNIKVSVKLDPPVSDSSNNKKGYVLQDSNNPNIIYYNNKAENQNGIYLQKVVEEGVTDTTKLWYKLLDNGTVTEMTDMKLPRLGGSSGYKGTYQVLYGDSADAAKVIAEFTVKGFAPSGTMDTSIGTETNGVWADAIAATATTVGNYVSSTSGTETTIIYNPNSVNKLVMTPEVTDCGAGSYLVIKMNDTYVKEDGATNPTHYDIEAMTLALTSDYTTEQKVEFIAVDNVGNEKSIKTYKFKAHTTAPKTNILSHMKDSSNSYWGSTGFTVDGIANAKNNGYKIIDTGIKYLFSNKISGSAYYSVIGSATEDSPLKISIPLNNSEKLPTINGKTYVSYSISYSYDGDAIEGRSKDYTAESNRTTPWTSLQEVTDNAVVIGLKNTDVPCFKTYVFVWLKDAIGNTSVYNVLSPEAENNSKWRNYWTSDTTAPTGTLVTLAATDNDADKLSKTEKTGNTTTFTYNKDGLWNFKVKVNVSDDVTGVDKIYLGTQELTNKSDKSLSFSNFTSGSYNITAKDKFGNQAVLHTIVFKPIENYRNGNVKLEFSTENYEVTPGLDASGNLAIGTDASINCKLTDNPTLKFTPSMDGMTIQSMSYKKNDEANETSLTNNTLTLSAGTFKIFAKYKNASAFWDNNEYSVQLFTLTVTDDGNIGRSAFGRTRFGKFVTETIPSTVVQPIKTRSVNLANSVQNFFTASSEEKAVTSAAKVEKKSKKTVKKAAKKATKKAAKKSSVKVEEVVPTNIIEEITPVVADSTGEGIETLLTEVTSLGDAAPAEQITEVVAVPESEVQLESAASQTSLPQANAPAVPSPVEVEVDEETSKVIYIVFAALLLAAGTAVFLITKKLLKRKK